jgi:hypothetical protein
VTAGELAEVLARMPADTHVLFHGPYGEEWGVHDCYLDGTCEGLDVVRLTTEDES